MNINSFLMCTFLDFLKYKHDYDCLKASKHDLFSKNITLRHHIKATTDSAGIRQLEQLSCITEVRAQMLAALNQQPQGPSPLPCPLSRKPPTCQHCEGEDRWWKYRHTRIHTYTHGRLFVGRGGRCCWWQQQTSPNGEIFGSSLIVTASDNPE